MNLHENKELFQDAVVATSQQLGIKEIYIEKDYWPIRIMKQMMMLPHENKTWLSFGHTFGFEEDEEFAPGVGFKAIMLAYSMELSDDFTNIQMENDNTAQVYTMIPLYEEELTFKKQNGANALLEKFDKFNIDEIVKVGRINVCNMKND